jgi:secreted PhoX family phosphatase
MLKIAASTRHPIPPARGIAVVRWREQGANAAAMFVNIQHPGEPASERSDPANPKAISAWPDGPGGARPRSATIAIRRRDGRPIGE